MKRKSELAMALDEMFCDDDKRRINAIKMLDHIANTFGPQRTRDQLVPFLNQFVDEDPPIILALLQEIEKIRPYLGGHEFEKLLLNPLINFCSSDQSQVAEASIKIIESILSKSTSQYMDVVKKLSKQEINVSKNAAILLMISGIQKLPHLEPTFIEIFKTMVFSEKASVRIVACKHLENLNKKLKNKEEIMKILQIIYNDAEDLTKLLTLDVLIQLYSFNSNFVMSKLKMLVGSNKWRFNLKLCESAQQLAQKVNKSHFKLILEPAFIAMMSSQDVDIKAKSCFALEAVAKNLTPEQNLTKLLPILQNLSSNKSLQVKVSFSKNIITLFPYFSPDKVKQKLLPITFSLLKQNKLEISTGIIQNFDSLAKELKSSEKIEQYILKPLINQLNFDDWRLRVDMLTLLGKLAIQQNFLAPTMIDLLITSCLDRVQAIRCSAIKIVISIIRKNSDEWIKLNLIPKLSKISSHANYLIRQKILIIVDETALNVGRPVISDYRLIVSAMLNDKIPNIRVMAMKVASSKPTLLEKNIEVQLLKMKDDGDPEVRQAARLIKI